MKHSSRPALAAMCVQTNKFIITADIRAQAKKQPSFYLQLFLNVRLCCQRQTSLFELHFPERVDTNSSPLTGATLGSVFTSFCDKVALIMLIYCGKKNTTTAAAAVERSPVGFQRQPCAKIVWSSPPVVEIIWAASSLCRLPASLYCSLKTQMFPHVMSL